MEVSKRVRGTGSVYLRGGTFWIKYHRFGKPFRESAHTDDRRKAEKFLKFRLAQLANHTFVGPQAERVTMDELAEDYLRHYRINGLKSLETAEARWLHLKPFFGDMRAVDVANSRDCLSRYVDRRQQQGAKNATINREMAALKRMFMLGRKAKKVREMPDFPHLEEHNVRRGFVEDSHYNRLAEACGRRGLWMRALFEAAYSLGWRVGELLSMRVSQVNLSERAMYLNDSKNGEPREAFMTPLLFELIQECVSGKGQDDFVFTRDDGKPILDFRGTWAAVREEAGFPKLLFHDLRRSAVRNMVRNDVPEAVAMKVTGHKTRAVFERYNIVSKNDLRSAAAKLARRDANRAEFGHKFGHKQAQPVPVATHEAVN